MEPGKRYLFSVISLTIIQGMHRWILRAVTAKGDNEKRGEKMEPSRNRITQFFKKYTFWKILALLALLFDTASTIYFMKKGGVFLELHPIVRYSALVWGPVLGTFLSAFVFKAAVGFFLEIFYQDRSRHSETLSYSLPVPECLRGSGYWDSLEEQNRSTH